MFHKQAMIDALRERKAKGLDLTIMIGHHKPGMQEGSPMEEKGESPDEEKKEQRELGLAPDGAESGHEEELMDMKNSRMAHDKEQMPGEGAMEAHLADNGDVGHGVESTNKVGDELDKMALGKRSLHGRVKSKSQEKAIHAKAKHKY